MHFVFYVSLQQKLVYLWLKCLLQIKPLQQSCTGLLTFIETTTKLFQKHFKPQKDETDFSWAMIHSLVRAFNATSLQEYLKLCFLCFWVCQEQHPTQLTMIHLCSAHMLRFIGMKLSQMQKRDKTFFVLFCLPSKYNSLWSDLVNDKVYCIFTFIKN